MPAAMAKGKPEHRSRISNIRIGQLLLVLGIIVHISFLLYFNFTQDDAFITFRYAANFLNGDGLVYNIGERLEGYTNFLWLIFIILGKQAGIGFILFSKIIGALCGAGTIWLSYLLGLKIFGRNSVIPGVCCLLLGAVYSFAYWTVSGLETPAFALTIVGALYYYSRKSLLTGVFLVLATLLRPEGGLVMLFVLVYEQISSKSFSHYLLALLTIYVLALLPYLLFKLYYFHGLFPNPFYAKTSFDMTQVVNGLNYTGQFFWHYLAAGLFALPLLISVKKLAGPVKMVSIFIVFYIVYIIIIGGDVLKVHRFFVPLFPLLIPIIVYGFSIVFIRKFIFGLAVLLLIAWQLYIPRNHVTSFHYAEKQLIVNMDKMMDALLAADTTDFSLAVSTIGVVGYRLIGHDVIDLLGLTDSTIARHPVPPVEGLSSTWKETKYNSKYVLSRQPKYILFSTGLKPSAPAERELFLYSQFLNSYRTVGFFFDGSLNDVYKLFYPITGAIVRDVDPEFVQAYNLAINQKARKKYPEAVANFEKAWRLSPVPKYQYIKYHMAYLIWLNGDFETYYKILKEIESSDTLIYYAYKDLYLYEMNVLHNTEAAKRYRDKLRSLVPWYVPRLDSMILKYQQEQRLKALQSG